MRQAPPIALTLSGAGAWRVAQVALPALAAAVLLAWAAASVALTLAAAAIVGVVAWRTGTPKPVHLQWTGEHWAVDGQAGEVDLMLDLGPWMLLRFRPSAGRRLWLPVPRVEAGAAEQGLRAALYARGSTALRRQA